MAKVPNEYLPLSTLGEFPDDWQEAKLTDVCRQVTDGTHDSPKPVSEGGYPLVTGKAIKDRRIDFSVTYNISEEDHNQVIARSKAEKDDILFANIGNSIGDLVRVQTNRQFSIKNVALFKPNIEKIHPRYLEYFLLSEQVQGFIKGSTRGSAQPFIGLSSLRGFPVPVPPLKEQQKIVEILGPLDDRITLLRETNATLEAIAMALFKSWFVDFDPVRAKMEGRAPEGMDEATAALFPDSFEETELGVVPRGWRVGTLADLMRLHKGSVNPGLQPETEFQHFSLPAFDNGQLPVLELGSTIKSNKTTVPSDGVLLSKLNPHIPRIWLPSEVLENAVCSTEFLPFVPTKETATSFVYCLLTNPGFSTALCQLVTGTSNSHQRIKPDGVLSMSSILPPPVLIAAFDLVVSAVLNRMKANRQQAQSISALRDTMLPRLISGQLRLPEAADAN